MWNFGLSASEGTYFRPEAERTLPRGRDIDDYREVVLGQDISFAWHHLQLWAEVYEVRFNVPQIGDADTLAYYLEVKYKFTPQFFAAMRWNQQLFDSVDNGTGGHARWGSDLARIDVAAGYRFTSHMQLKLQYSFQQETTGPGDDNHTLAAQLTVRF
jgi:predicted porin